MVVKGQQKSLENRRLKKVKKINKIYRMVLLGYDRSFVLNYARKKRWDISKKTVDNYYAEVSKMIKEDGIKYRDEMLGKAHLRLEMLFNRCFRRRDYRTALLVQKELNEISGLREYNFKIKGDKENPLEVHHNVRKELQKDKEKYAGIIGNVLKDMGIVGGNGRKRVHTAQTNR